MWNAFSLSLSPYILTQEKKAKATVNSDGIGLSLLAGFVTVLSRLFILLSVYIKGLKGG